MIMPELLDGKIIHGLVLIVDEVVSPVISQIVYHQLKELIDDEYIDDYQDVILQIDGYLWIMQILKLL